MFSESENQRHAMAHVRREIQRAGGAKEIRKEKLVELSESLGLTVTRADGGEGDPTKADFLRAIGL